MRKCIHCIIIAVNIVYQVDGSNCHTNDDKLHSKNVSGCDIYQETSNNDKLIKDDLEIDTFQEINKNGNVILNQLKTNQLENNTKLNIRVSEHGLDYDSNLKSEHNKVAFENINDSRDQLNLNSINNAYNSSDTVSVSDEKLDEIQLNRTEDHLQDQLVNEQNFVKLDKSEKLPLTEKGNETKTNNNVVLNMETNFLNKGFSVDGNHEKVPTKAKSSSNSLDLVTTRKVYNPEYFKLVFDKKYLDLDVSDEPYIVNKIPVDNKKVLNENEIQNDLILNINNNQNEFNKILVNNNDHLLREDIGYYLVPLDTKEKITGEKESKEIDTDIRFRIIPGFPKFNTNIYHLNYRRMNDPVNITEDSSNDVTENKFETTVEESYNEKYKTRHESAIKDLDETDIRINKENNEQLVNNLDRNGYKYYNRVIPGIPNKKMKDDIPNTRIISRQHIETINIQDLRQELLNHLLDYIINIIRKDKADDNSEARLVEKLRDKNSRYLEVVVLSDNIFENIPHMSESSTYYSKLKTSNNTAPLNIDIINTKNVTYPNNVHNFAHGYDTNYEVNNIYSMTENYKNDSTIMDIVSNDMQPKNFKKITNYANVDSDLYDLREQYGSKKLNEENSVKIKNTKNIKNSEDLLNPHDDLNTNYSDMPAKSTNEKQDIANLNNIHDFEISANYIKTGNTTKHNNSSISPDKTINIDKYLLDDKNSQHQYFIVPDFDNITDSSRLTESVNKEQNPNLLNNSAKEVVDVTYIIHDYSEHQKQSIKEKERNNIIELLNSLTSDTILHDTNVFSSDHETVVSNYFIHDDNRNQTEILKENSNNIVLSKPVNGTNVFNSYNLLNTNYYGNTNSDKIIKIFPSDNMETANDKELHSIITLNLDHNDHSIGEIFDNINTADSDYNDTLHDGTLSEFPGGTKVTNQQVNEGIALNSISTIDNVSNAALHDYINNHITYDTIKNDTINFTLEPSITIKKEFDFLTADNQESLGKRIKSILLNVNVTYY